MLSCLSGVSSRNQQRGTKRLKQRQDGTGLSKLPKRSLSLEPDQGKNEGMES